MWIHASWTWALSGIRLLSESVCQMWMNLQSFSHLLELLWKYKRMPNKGPLWALLQPETQTWIMSLLGNTFLYFFLKNYNYMTYLQYMNNISKHKWLNEGRKKGYFKSIIITTIIAIIIVSIVVVIIIT